jgi:hypothetical protein
MSLKLTSHTELTILLCYMCSSVSRWCVCLTSCSVNTVLSAVQPDTVMSTLSLLSLPFCVLVVDAVDIFAGCTGLFSSVVVLLAGVLTASE